MMGRVTKDNPRALAWRFHWYRQSELEGALLLGRMVRLAGDGHLCQQLTRHCADEARHALLWSETIADLGLPHVRIHRSYQSLYLEEGGAPATLVEVLAFTQIFERRVHKQFQSELRGPAMPDRAKRTFRVMIEDEKGHLGWVRDWLEARPESGGLLRRYQEIDLAVYRKVQSYEDCLWAWPDLGQESRAENAVSTTVPGPTRDPITQQRAGETTKRGEWLPGNVFSPPRDGGVGRGTGSGE